MAKRAYAADIQAMYDYIASDLVVARSVISNLVKITANWNLRNRFSSSETRWLLSMPVPRVTGSAYRGMSIKRTSLHKFVRGKKIRFRPQYQVSSWSTKSSGLEYFQRGQGVPVTLKVDSVPSKNFNVQGFFKLVNKLHTKLSEDSEIGKLDKIGIKVYDLLDSVQLYNENEVLLFGPIICTVLRVD